MGKNYRELKSCSNCKYCHIPNHWIDWPEFYCEKECEGEYEKLYNDWAIANDNNEETLPYYKKLSYWIKKHEVKANYICDEYK